jgi:hypothetical protein
MYRLEHECGVLLTIGDGERAIGLRSVSFLCVMAGLASLCCTPHAADAPPPANGRATHATVRREWRNGPTAGRLLMAGEAASPVAFELEVPDDGGDYAARALALLTDDEEAAIKLGDEVAIRVDPDHPRSVAVVGPIRPTPA